MATDATGTPTSILALPKLNVGVDPPTGKGINAMMDAIDTAVAGKPSGIASGEVPVWNGSTWVRSSVTNIGVTSLGSGSPSGSNFLRGDGTWAVPSTVSLPSPATTLPGSPANGDWTILVDSTSAPTYQWLLRYNSSEATYKWEYMGGAPAYVEVTTDEATTSATYAALATAGPSFTLPYSGDYFVGIGFTHGATGTNANTIFMSYDIGGTGAVDADSVRTIGNVRLTHSRFKKKSGLTAVTLTAKYKSDGTNNHSFQERWMAVHPWRII